MRLIAIDPGLEASAAFYCPGNSFESGMRWRFFDVPVIEGRKRPDAKTLRDWIMRYSPDRAFVELVGAMPVDGKRQISTFMRAAGYIEATVLCCGVPMSTITPQRWKRFHGMPVGADKEVSRQWAIRLLPELAGDFSRKKDHGRAEAALLALFGAHLLAPIPGE